MKYRATSNQETFVGVGLAVYLPLGQYAESTIDHVPKDDEERNVAWSLALGIR